MPSDSQIFVLWEVYIYRYTTNCKCLLIWILCTLSKRTIFIYIHVLVGFYMKTTHCFVNIFHVSYEWLNILRCVFTVLFSRPLFPKNERKKISATNSALLVYSFSRHECQCGCNKVCLWIKLLFVFTITGEDLRKKKEDTEPCCMAGVPSTVICTFYILDLKWIADAMWNMNLFYV